MVFCICMLSVPNAIVEDVQGENALDYVYSEDSNDGDEGVDVVVVVVVDRVLLGKPDGGH